MKETHVDDYVARIHEKWPEYTEADIRKILTRAWNRYVTLVCHQCDVMIKDRTKGMFYTGNMYSKGKPLLDHYRYRALRKVQMRGRRSKAYDGYYYFGTFPTVVKKLEDGSVYYGNVIMLQTKQLAQLMQVGKFQDMYRVPYKSKMGFKVYVQNFRSKYAERVSYSIKETIPVMSRIVKNTDKWIKYQ